MIEKETLCRDENTDIQICDKANIVDCGDIGGIGNRNIDFISLYRQRHNAVSLTNTLRNEPHKIFWYMGVI